MEKNYNIEPLTAKDVHENVLRLIFIKNGKVLDAAAGFGALSKKLDILGLDVYPIDIDNSKFQYKKLKCQRMDLNKKIPFEDDFFDLVVSVETIEHLENPWFFIREISRIIRPKGQLIITTPNITNLFSRILFLFFGRYILFCKSDIFKKGGHITPLTKWTLEGILEKGNFYIEDVECSSAYIPILKRYFKTKILNLGHILIISARKK